VHGKCHGWAITAKRRRKDQGHLETGRNRPPRFNLTYIVNDNDCFAEGNDGSDDNNVDDDNDDSHHIWMH
jgi:hypothetical protein